MERRVGTVLVAGAGIMGAGIAGLAAQHGHRVLLYDARQDAAARAKGEIAAGFERLVAKGKLPASEAAKAGALLEAAASLEDATAADVVIEAIVEDAEAKRALFARLEDVVAPHCILASNTSSLSITTLARGLRVPGRLVGMHFFNPVPLMRLVEVVSGLRTDPAVAAAVAALATAWGKTAVHARSTPGFIVNRIARPYYAEALALIAECAAAPETIDAALRAAGFRMGPCELMDLIGHDTNFAVTSSVFEANFNDRRYAPSYVQRELVDGGLLGRKSSHGFYRYPEGAPHPTVTPAPALERARHILVCGRGAIADHLARRIAPFAATLEREPGAAWTGLRVGDAALAQTDGRTALELGAALDTDDVAVFDWPPGAHGNGGALAYAGAATASARWSAQAPSWIAALGFVPLNVADTPGLVAARTIAMVVNEACDAVTQGVCDRDAADAAMRLGANYPLGPFAWLERLGAAAIVSVLEALDRHYRGERYRISPLLLRERILAARSGA